MDDNQLKISFFNPEEFDDTKQIVKKIPSKLRKNGFTYTQICRGGRSFVYEQTITPEIKYYEVFELRIQPGWKMNGYSYPAKERFPGNEDFGIWAWTFKSLERAMNRFNDLEKQQIDHTSQGQNMQPLKITVADPATIEQI